jgi:hypothetical protein
MNYQNLTRVPVQLFPHYDVSAMARFRISLITFIAAGIAITALLIACTPTDSAFAALPAGMRTALVPSVAANAYLYFKSPGTTTFSSEARGLAGFQLQSADFLLADDSVGVAARLIIDSHGDLISPSMIHGDESVVWADADATSFRFGPLSPWGNHVRTAWARQPSESFPARYPGVWKGLQSMPEAPPSSPIAAGFVRNFGPLLQDLISKADIAAPNLAEGLSLGRVDSISFVVYSDAFTQLPESIGPGLLRDLDISILAVADSAYPAFVVGLVLDAFVSALRLDPIGVASATVYQGKVAEDIHVVVFRDSATLFFAIAHAPEQAIALVEAVVTSRSLK